MTWRLTMSNWISPSCSTDRSPLPGPYVRLVMTTTRARSSSGEKGTVSTSSTPWSKASSLRLRSPRRVSARIGTAPAPAGALSGRRDCRPAEVHVDDRHVRLPLGNGRPRVVQRGDIARHERTVVQGEADQVDDQRLVGQDEHAMRRRFHRHHDETVMIRRSIVNKMTVRQQVPRSVEMGKLAHQKRGRPHANRIPLRLRRVRRMDTEATESLRRWVKGARRVDRPRR